MRVAMYYRNSDVRLQEMPKPEIGPSEMLVKVIASGICGSDVMEWYRVKRAPLVLGHEIAGDIVQVGKDVSGFKKGQRVFVSHHVPCMTCRYCLAGHHSTCDSLRTTNFYPGGFAEYIRVPKANVELGTYALPKELTYDDGAFIEPLACVVRGFRLAGFRQGMTVLVLGSGIAGLLNIKLAKAMGAEKIIATPGKQDGLAWRNPDGTTGGPLGEELADAIAEGYTKKSAPFHGYYFKVLKGQGPAAPLGEMDFVVKGVMIGGFALVAAPADYRVSGVKTFIVSHDGIVYEKDLGPKTLDEFRAMELYNPDKTWRPVESP